MWLFMLMIRSGGALAATGWFVFGSGIFFGAGLLLWGLIPDLHPTINASGQTVATDMTRANLLNSASTVIVLLPENACAWVDALKPGTTLHMGSAIGKLLDVKK